MVKLRSGLCNPVFTVRCKKISYDNKIKNGTECEKSRFPDAFIINSNIIFNLCFIRESQQILRQLNMHIFYILPILLLILDLIFELWECTKSRIIPICHSRGVNWNNHWVVVTICAFISSGGGGLDDMVLMSLLCSLLCCDFRVGLGLP